MILFKKIIKSLSSLRLTIWLISILTIIFAFGLWIPQKNLVKELYFEWQRRSPTLVAILDTLQLTSIYTSPVTLAAWSLFFINLALVMWQRLPVIRSRIAISDEKIVAPDTAPGYPFKETYRLPPGCVFETVVDKLRKRNYELLTNKNGFYGIKNRYSPLAFAFFHLSFFLILLGGIISVYTQFRAYVDLAQGETFLGEPERYNQSPSPLIPKIGSIPKVSFVVGSVVPRVTGNTPTGIAVTLVDAGGKEHVVGINSPYKVDNTSFVFKHLGMAPLFVATDSSGKEIDGAIIKLDVLQGRRDGFKMAGYNFSTVFYPDYVRFEGRDATKTQEFNNPTFKILVERGGKKITEALLSKKGSLEFEGIRLEMRDLSYWVRFYVIRERGIAILYTGLAIATVAIIWRLLFFRREIVGAVKEDEHGAVLAVAGRSDFYKSLAEDEFAKLFDGVLSELKAEG